MTYDTEYMGMAIDLGLEIGKFNPNHLPAGSPEGGQFASAEGSRNAPWQQSKDKFVGTGNWDQSKFERQRAWDSSVRAAMSEGKLPPADAYRLGYHASNHEEDYDQNGRVISQWQDLPQTLYHVTTNVSGVESSGLKSREQLGQGLGLGLGGGDETSISFTTNREQAESIYHTMQEAAKVARGDITTKDLIEAAQQGTGAKAPYLEPIMCSYQSSWKTGQPLPVYVEANLQGMQYEHGFARKESDLPEGAKFIGHTWMGGDGIRRGSEWMQPASKEKQQEFRFELYKTFLAFRGYAGGSDNPLFFSSDVKGLAKTKLSDIGIVTAHPVPHAQGYPLSSMQEWRTHSGKAVNIISIEKPSYSGRLKKGGPGSGNFGHAGRPGEVGGSGPGDGAESSGLKQWFGNSKVVDNAGKPLIVYHATNVNPKDLQPGTHFGSAEAANARAETLRSFSEDIVHRPADAFQVMPVYLHIENPLRLPDLADVDSNTGLSMEEANARFQQEHPTVEEQEHAISTGDAPQARSWEEGPDGSGLAETLREQDIITSDEFWDHQYSSNEKLFTLLEEKGYDGIVYENAVEDPGHDSWIIFHPSQIRSAFNKRLRKGGVGSGYFGHEGRPGFVGGSSSGTAESPLGVSTSPPDFGRSGVKGFYKGGKYYYGAAFRVVHADIAEGLPDLDPDPSHAVGDALAADYIRFEASPTLRGGTETQGLFLQATEHPQAVKALSRVLSDYKYHDFGYVVVDIGLNGFEASSVQEAKIKLAHFNFAKGGAGSGNFGHEGRPGLVGGSAASDTAGTGEATGIKTWAFPIDTQPHTPGDQVQDRINQILRGIKTAHLSEVPDIVRLGGIGNHEELSPPTHFGDQTVRMAEGIRNAFDQAPKDLADTLRDHVQVVFADFKPSIAMVTVTGQRVGQPPAFQFLLVNTAMNPALHPPREVIFADRARSQTEFFEKCTLHEMGHLIDGLYQSQLSGTTRNALFMISMNEKLTWGATHEKLSRTISEYAGSSVAECAAELTAMHFSGVPLPSDFANVGEYLDRIAPRHMVGGKPSTAHALSYDFTPAKSFAEWARAGSDDVIVVQVKKFNDCHDPHTGEFCSTEGGGEEAQRVYAQAASSWRESQARGRQRIAARFGYPNRGRSRSTRNFQEVDKGGPGSGNFGHSGRPGLVGGSGSAESEESYYQRFGEQRGPVTFPPKADPFAAMPALYKAGKYLRGFETHQELVDEFLPHHSDIDSAMKAGWVRLNLVTDRDGSGNLYVETDEKGIAGALKVLQDYREFPSIDKVTVEVWRGQPGNAISIEDTSPKEARRRLVEATRVHKLNDLAIAWFEKEFNEEDHPRVPAGSSEGGQFTAAEGGTGTAPAGEKQGPALIGVQGAKWTEGSAKRAFDEVKPKLDAVANRLAGTSVPSNEHVPEDWDELSSDQQDQVERAFVDSYEGGPPSSWDEISDDQQREARDRFIESGQDDEENSQFEMWKEDQAESELGQILADDEDWKDEQLDSFLEDHPEIHVTAESLHDAVIFDNEEGDVTIDTNKLISTAPPVPEGQEELPFEHPLSETNPPTPLLSEDQQQVLSEYLGIAFKSELEDRIDKADPPDWIPERAAESLGEYWDEMDDEGRYDWAERNLSLESSYTGQDAWDNMDDSDRWDYAEGMLDDLTDVRSIKTLEMPTKWDPFDSQTREFAGALAGGRYKDLIQERGIDSSYSYSDFERSMGPEAWREASQTEKSTAIRTLIGDEFGGHTPTPLEKESALKSWGINQNLASTWDAAKVYLRGTYESTQYVLNRAGVPMATAYKMIQLPSIPPGKVSVERVHGTGESGSATYRVKTGGKDLDVGVHLRADGKLAASIGVWDRGVVRYEEGLRVPIGVSGVRQIIARLKQDFPAATGIMGERVTGIHAKPGSTQTVGRVTLKPRAAAAAKAADMTLAELLEALVREWNKVGKLGPDVSDVHVDRPLGSDKKRKKKPLVLPEFEKGGPGSGNFGHAGRPGLVGGSSSEDVAGGTSYQRPTPIHVSSVSDAIKLILGGKTVEMPDVKSVHTLLNKLANVAIQAEKQGKDAPNYDLCNVSVAGTNIFCGDSLGLPRIQMPQLKGVPVPGKPAEQRLEHGQKEVDGSLNFMRYLHKQGIRATDEKVPAAYLRASQRELIGPKVAAMMRDRSFDPKERAIFISRDNYIVDGHHRWAAAIGRDAKDGVLGDIKLRAIRVDAPISEVLHLANTWSKEFGIRQKAGVTKFRFALIDGELFSEF